MTPPIVDHRSVDAPRLTHTLKMPRAEPFANLLGLLLERVRELARDNELAHACTSRVARLNERQLLAWLVGGGSDCITETG